MDLDEGRLRFLRRTTDRPGRRFRRGVYLLPSLFTLGNMFCGYACVVYAMRQEFQTAAFFIGLAIALDMLDGRIARLTGTESAFGLEFESLADVISFAAEDASDPLVFIDGDAFPVTPIGPLIDQRLAQSELIAVQRDARGRSISTTSTPRSRNPWSAR